MWSKTRYVTFHETDWLIGILIMAYYNPHIMRSISRSIQTANDQGFGYCSCRYDEYTSGQRLGPSWVIWVILCKTTTKLKGAKGLKDHQSLLKYTYTSHFNSIPWSSNIAKCWGGLMVDICNTCFVLVVFHNGMQSFLEPRIPSYNPFLVGGFDPIQKDISEIGLFPQGLGLNKIFQTA